MAVTPTPIYPQTISMGVVQILPADTTSLKTIYTGATNGSVINHINISSTDTSARDLQFYITIGGTDYLLATVACPLNSGNTNAVPLLTILDNPMFGVQLTDVNGNKALYLPSGAILKVKSLTTVTAAKAISIIAQAGDY